MTAIHIQGLGTYVPTKRITNVDLMSLVDTNDEWIVSRTGIKARHMLAIHSSLVSTSDIKSTFVIRLVGTYVPKP